MEEKRKYSRVAFHVEATIKTPNDTVSGKIDNLSMKGLFLNTDRKLPGNTLMDISIRLSGSELSIDLRGEAVRNTAQGVAIEFREMDLDSYTHLRKVIQYNSADADSIDEEIEQSFKSENWRKPYH